MHPYGKAILVAWPTDMVSLSDSRTIKVSTMYGKTSYKHKIVALLLTTKGKQKYYAVKFIGKF
jgi:hypothetical protein